MRATALVASGALLVLAAVISVAPPCRAQQMPEPAQNSAHDLAQRVDRHYNTLRSLKAGFTETYEGMGMSRSESGNLLLVKPGRMKWEYDKPPGKFFLLDGSFSWFYSPGDPQVQRIPAKELDDLRSPMRLLLGHTRLEKEIGNLTVASAPNGRFTLTGVPKGLEKRVVRLALTVTADGAIAGIEVEETDGALTRFTFTDEQPDAPIPLSTFRLSVPAGVPIVDSLPPA